jgi:hypothetical protein
VVPTPQALPGSRGFHGGPPHATLILRAPSFTTQASYPPLSLTGRPATLGVVACSLHTELEAPHLRLALPSALALMHPLPSHSTSSLPPMRSRSRGGQCAAPQFHHSWSYPSPMTSLASLGASISNLTSVDSSPLGSSPSIYARCKVIHNFPQGLSYFSFRYPKYIDLAVDIDQI